MSVEWRADDQGLHTSPEGANLDLSPEYDTGPEVLHIPQPRQDDQKEPDKNREPEVSKGKIWGMKRKTFMIALGIFVVLIIAVAAGVGWGVGVTAARSRNNNNGASESRKSMSQDSSSSSPTPSSDPSEIITTVSAPGPATPTPTQNTPLAAFSWNSSHIQIFYKLPDGTIGSRDSDGSKWLGQWDGIIKPKANSPLAAIGWLEGDVRQVRVYSVSERNTLRESRANSATPSVWITRGVPSTEDPATVAAGSYLTACTWPNDAGQGVRVYYQDPEGHIQEVSWDSGDWKSGPQPGI